MPGIAIRSLPENYQLKVRAMTTAKAGRHSQAWHG
jgi:hypothetical protein